MSISEANLGATSANTEKVSEVANKPRDKKTKLQLLKEKFIAGKNYILSHKEAFSKIGQVGGTAALITGGASLLFSGIAANLTVAGTPLGIPLMIAGGVLFAAGTILQVARHVEKSNSSTGEKIKGFFNDSWNNIKTGILAGLALSGGLVFMPLEKLIVSIPVLIKLKGAFSKDLNQEENWKAFVAQFPKDSKYAKTLGKYKTKDEFLKALFDPAQKIIENLGKSDKAKPVSTSESSAEPTKPEEKPATEANKSTPKSSTEPVLDEAVTQTLALSAAA